MARLGIPYASCAKDADGRWLTNIHICPVCGEHIEETERKDFESFSNSEYAKHYKEKHEASESPSCHQYVLVLNQGTPLIIVRLPLKGTSGKLKTAVTGSARNRALTKLMREHGMRQRDVLALDNASHPDSFGDDPMLHGAATRAEARAHHEKLDRAFAEGTGFSDFSLYDWHDEHGFVLVRRPRFRDGTRVVLTEDYPVVTLDRQVATMPAGSVGTVVQMGVSEERWVVFGEIPVVPMDRAVAVRTSALREE